MYTESELISELKRGNEQAVAVLIERYGHRLLRTALGITGDLQAAEEVVQDTFLQTCRKINDFREDAALSTWLFRITVNGAKNKIRGSWFRRGTVMDEVTLNLLPGPAENQPAEVVARAESRRDVTESLKTIPLLYREVLILYYMEDLNVKEISLVLEQPEGTIKSKLFRGRDLLKAKLVQKEVAF